MDYFAGLDISMDEMHVCVLDREGVVVRESKAESTAEAIADELAKAPSCRRIVFETGQMAPILFHGLSQLGLPVVCVGSRQAYQALKSLATQKADRNDARGLAHLPCTGFFKPVHMKSLPAHAVRSLISARKKLVGQRVTLENQIRGLAVVFGIRLPRALTAAFIDQALKASEGVAALRGHLAEFGVIAAKGISHVEELVERATAAADLPAMVQATLGVLLAQLRSLDAAIDELERAIVADHRRDPVSRLAASVPGVGALAASAILASAPDPQAFKSGRDFAAWLGVTPRQNSTGGKEKFGSITKQDNRYIRRLLVLGAISVLRAAPKRKGALCDWLAALRARKPPKVVAVALANKLARIVWAIITTGEVFRTSIYAKA